MDEMELRRAGSRCVRKGCLSAALAVTLSLGFFARRLVSSPRASSDSLVQTAGDTLKSPWMVLRMISLVSLPSKGSLPQSSRKRMTPTDHRSASLP